MSYLIEKNEFSSPKTYKKLNLHANNITPQNNLIQKSSKVNDVKSARTIQTSQFLGTSMAKKYSDVSTKSSQKEIFRSFINYSTFKKNSNKKNRDFSSKTSISANKNLSFAAGHPKQKTYSNSLKKSELVSSITEKIKESNTNLIKTHQDKLKNYQDKPYFSAMKIKNEKNEKIEKIEKSSNIINLKNASTDYEQRVKRSVNKKNPLIYSGFKTTFTEPNNYISDDTKIPNLEETNNNYENNFSFSHENSQNCITTVKLTKSFDNERIKEFRVIEKLEENNNENILNNFDFSKDNLSKLLNRVKQMSDNYKSKEKKWKIEKESMIKQIEILKKMVQKLQQNKPQENQIFEESLDYI